MKKSFLIAAMLAASSVTFAADTAQSGKDIYTKYCIACHMSGVAGAPKVHDEAAWKDRYDKAQATVKQENPNLDEATLKQKTYEALIQVVKKGLNAMPPGGMCPSCTDAEYQAAIEFMMSKQEPATP